MATSTDERVDETRATSGVPDPSRSAHYTGLTESAERFHALAVDVAASGRVLAIGCGDETVDALIARGIEVERVATSSAEALPFVADAFDGVVGASFLHQLDVERVYAEIARVVRPDGRVVLIEPLGHNPVLNAYRRRTPENRLAFEHPLRWADFTLAERWFAEVHVEMFHLLATLTAPIAHRWWGKPLHALLTKLDRRLLSLNERMRWQAWIAVAVFRSR